MQARPTINLHTHFFSIDHTPEAQFYYLFVEYLAKGLCPLTRRQRQHPRILEKRLERGTLWVRLQLHVVRCLSRYVCHGLMVEDLRGLLRMAVQTSFSAISTVREKLGLTEEIALWRFLDLLFDRAKYYRDQGEPRDFGAALAELARNLYAAHASACPPGSHVTHQDMYRQFIAASTDLGVPFSRVVLLTVDFDEAFRDHPPSFGLQGKPRLSFDDQLREVEALVAAVAASPSPHPELIPFLCVDPRRFPTETALLAWARARLAPAGVFRGVKLYPPLGVPVSSIPIELFEHCRQHALPVTAHASRFGAGARGQDAERAEFARPRGWRPTLAALAATWDGDPSHVLRVNLAHFAELQERHDEWVDELLALMAEFDGSRGVIVYSDISNDLVVKPNRRRRYRRNAQRVRDLGFEDRVLFGSDWWNNLPASHDEAYYLAQLGYDTGEAPFDGAVLDANARRFLP